LDLIPGEVLARSARGAHRSFSPGLQGSLITRRVGERVLDVRPRIRAAPAGEERLIGWDVGGPEFSVGLRGRKLRIERDLLLVDRRIARRLCRAGRLIRSIDRRGRTKDCCAAACIGNRP
jgi:hypothetical protein